MKPLIATAFACSIAMGGIPQEYPISEGGNGHYYEVVRTRATWDDARREASRRDLSGVSGHLATIGTSGEQAFVHQLVENELGGGQQAWLGGGAATGSVNRDLSWQEGAEGVEIFLGPNGTELWRTFEGAIERRFNNFLLIEGRPQASDGGHFAINSTSGEWIVSPTNAGELAYVIEYPVPPPSRPLQWGRDADGNLHWYELVTQRRTYPEATADAESKIFRGHRGHLATITNHEEWEFAYHLIIGNIDLDPVGLAFLGATSDLGTVNRDYTWRQGPETGTLFYSAGPIPGQYHNFDPDLEAIPVFLFTVGGEVLMDGQHGQWSATSSSGFGLNRALIEWSIEDGGCIADVAEPIGVLDLGDIGVFVDGVMTQSPYIDNAPPFGVIDLADISAFIAAFQAGCD